MKTVPVFAAMALMIFYGCKDNGRSEIEQAAYGYLDATANYRFEDARHYASPQTCEVTLAFFDRLMTKVDSSVIKRNTPAEITIKKSEQTSDTTAYVLFHKTTPKKTQDDTLQMVRTDGRWLAHVVITVPKLPGLDTTAHKRKINREMFKNAKFTPIKRGNAVQKQGKSL